MPCKFTVNAPDAVTVTTMSSNRNEEIILLRESIDEEIAHIEKIIAHGGPFFSKDWLSFCDDVEQVMQTLEDEYELLPHFIIEKSVSRISECIVHNVTRLMKYIEYKDAQRIVDRLNKSQSIISTFINTIRHNDELFNKDIEQIYKMTAVYDKEKAFNRPPQSSKRMPIRNTVGNKMIKKLSAQGWKTLFS